MLSFYGHRPAIKIVNQLHVELVDQSTFTSPLLKGKTKKQLSMLQFNGIGLFGSMPNTQHDPIAGQLIFENNKTGTLSGIIL
ncbi:hypothetical protein [Phaeocystidibacter marisrubri]|uniref:Uncharacterized protein n=1 Tax=Phaeocystidibacter marisrubri TaxID=1577780 RepID=A0A6L3ZCS8_9FLAO|nr:hypothetical protein [Phaeocystidibacter marisrubri]KAB2815034.1 hypothetical protein F8C82_14575 [Phaeocystidibacter marisrubri]GGH78090.1 hypothetical protein GCM10011318_28790 [Phaeocystidibacter marisrubri]